MRNDNQVDRRLLLYIVVRQRAPILELFALKYQPLISGINIRLLLDQGLDGLDGICGIDIERDFVPAGKLDEDLHAAAEARDHAAAS